MNIEKLIKYIKDYAEQSEEQAYKWASDGCFNEAYKAQVIADFLREDLVKGIEKELTTTQK